MRIIRAAAASVGILALSLTAASPALGVAWASASSPIYGSEGGKNFGKMYGSFYNDASVSAMSTTYQYDLEPGGNNVRVETDFWFYEYDTSCNSGSGGTCWNFDVSKQTVETNTAKWVKDSRARNLHGGAERARGGIDICEIQAWQNDPCSPHAYPSFSY